MKFQNSLLVVTDMERAKSFYQEILGLEVVMDLGANVVLTGGIALQSKGSWAEFLSVQPETITFGGLDTELYFEEEHFDAFAERLGRMKTVQYVHPVQEHPWGQRVVRFFDPDQHVIEVGEPMDLVCKRFLDSGMTPEEVAKRMDVPIEYIRTSEEQ